MQGRQFLYIAIATLVTVILWASLDILHSRSTVTIPSETKSLIEPISPDFDKEAISELR